MNKLFESAVIELETITPLFVKGKEIKYGEGMLKGKDGRIYLIDNDKLCDYIYHKTYDESGNRIQEGEEFDYVQIYSDEFSKSKSPSLKKFFDEHPKIKPSDKYLRGMAKGITRIPEESKKEKFFVRNAMEKVFIPGSSIKGAIRNAVLWKIMSDSGKKQWLNELVRKYKTTFEAIIEIKKAMKLAGKKRWKDANNIIESVFQTEFEMKELLSRAKDKEVQDKINYYGKNSIKDALKSLENRFIIRFSENAKHTDPENQNSESTLGQKSFVLPKNCFGEKYSPRWEATNEVLRDFFRIAKISDANFVDETVPLKEIKIDTICANPNNVYQKRYGTKLECVPAGIKAKFKITVDLETAEKFFGNEIPCHLKSVEGLLKTVNEFFQSVWSVEKDFFEKNKKKHLVSEVYDFYSKHQKQEDQYLFRTGWGGGMVGKTQFINIEEELRRLVRDADARQKNSSPVVPKSRCLVIDKNRAKSPLGWCILKVLKNEKQIPAIKPAKFETGNISSSSDAQSLSKASPKSRYKKGEVLRSVRIIKESGIFKVKIARQSELASLSTEPPNHDADKVNITVKEISDEGIVTLVYVNSVYHMSDSIKKAQWKTTEDKTYKVRIAHQMQWANLTGKNKPTSYQRYVNGVVTKIIDGIVTQVRGV